MRVIVNGLAGLKQKTGVGHYTANLSAALGRAFPRDHYHIYPGEPFSGVARRFLAGQGGQPSGGKSRLPPGAGLLAKHAVKVAAGVHFARTAAAFDVYFEPNFIPFSSPLPTVVTVHDVSVLRHPEFHPADRVKMHERHFLPAMRRADRVAVMTEAVRRELVRDAGVPAEKVVRVPFSFGSDFRPHSPEEIAPVLRRHGLPTRYFLCVGTVEPRKNLLTAMRAFCDLPAAVREACPLVLVGPWGWRSVAEREFFDGPGKVAGIRHAGYVPSADLPAVYAGAAVLLFPSVYEGVGLPPVEMLATGGAVIASQECDAVREVVGPAGWFLPAADVAAWRDEMRKVADDPHYAATLSPNGAAWAAQYDWDSAAKGMRAVFADALRGRSARAA